jgi:single-strand DNA-binding protein
MEIAGRVTADATVTTTKSDKKVVNFSIAINDSFKAKGATEYTEIVNYINCSYWQSEKVAQVLKKGAMVQCFGRIGVNAYLNSAGEAVGSLTFHTNDLKVLVYAKKEEPAERAPIDMTANKAGASKADEQHDDLPF